MKNFAVGFTGTFAALELPAVSHFAASVAGFATAVWMVTQTVLAIRAAGRRRK